MGGERGCEHIQKEKYQISFFIALLTCVAISVFPGLVGRDLNYKNIYSNPYFMSKCFGERGEALKNKLHREPSTKGWILKI